MIRSRTLLGLTIFVACLAAPGATFAQSGGLLGDLFNRGGEAQQTQAVPPPTAVPQGSGSVEARIGSIENALRQLTGQIEVLQHQNQQLQMQLKRMQDDTEYRFQQLGSGRNGAPARPNVPGNRSEAIPPMQNPNPNAPPNQTVARGGQGDAFNPALNPNAPGAPRPLGGGVPGQVANQVANQGVNEVPIGVPGGREAGAPLDLNALASTLSGSPAAPGANPAATGTMPAGQLPPPPPRNPSATGTQLATLPPSATPKDEYELAYGYVLHKDYGLATQALQAFVRKHPNDPLVPDARYWLGESLYQQQNYEEAARAFLAVSTQHKQYAKAPDALLRLGQSLAALNHKEAACATLREVKNKFPRASSSVKRGVAQELKRVHC